MKKLEHEKTNKIIWQEDFNHVDRCNPFLLNCIQQCRRFVCFEFMFVWSDDIGSIWYLIHMLSNSYAIWSICYLIHMLSDPYVIWSICYLTHMLSDLYAIWPIWYLIKMLFDSYAVGSICCLIHRLCCLIHRLSDPSVIWSI